MAQQTAVEWLGTQLISEGIYVPFGMYEQAKQMEKEQIIAAWKKNPEGYNHSGERYYNETYGTTNSNEVTDQHL